jgi:hypothetical protein
LASGYPPALAPVFAACITAEKCTIDILESSPGRSMGDRGLHTTAVATLHAKPLILAANKWSGPMPAFSLDLQTMLSISFFDSTSLAESTLLEPFEFRASFSQGQQLDVGQRDNEIGIFWESGLPLENLEYIMAKQQPGHSGQALAIEAPMEPVTINFSELTLKEFQRLAKAAGSADELEPALQVMNRTERDILLRQVGASTICFLENGGAVAFNWPGPDIRRSLEFAMPANKTWSDPIDVRPLFPNKCLTAWNS